MLAHCTVSGFTSNGASQLNSNHPDEYHSTLTLPEDAPYHPVIIIVVVVTTITIIHDYHHDQYHYHHYQHTIIVITTTAAVTTTTIISTIIIIFTIVFFREESAALAAVPRCSVAQWQQAGSRNNGHQKGLGFTVKKDQKAVTVYL